MKISTEKKLDNFRNMRAMIDDYFKLHNRSRTNKEMQEKLDMSAPTVQRYKAVIFKEMKEELAKKFNDDIVLSAGKIIEKINKSITTFEEIRDGEEKASDKISAAREVILAEQYKLKVMQDGIIFLEEEDNSNGNDNAVRTDKQHIHRETKSEERIQESIKSMYS